MMLHDGVNRGGVRRRESGDAMHPTMTGRAMGARTFTVSVLTIVHPLHKTPPLKT